MNIAYFDLTRRFGPDRDIIKSILREVALSGEFILRSRVTALEARIAAETGAPQVVATSSGTAGLLLALAALDIGPGDEVLTPAWSFPASANVIALRGATPVFVDVDPTSGVMDTLAIEAAITPATRAMMAVHLHSAQMDMAALRQLADRRNLRVVEDSAVCYGASQHGRALGLHGDVGVYSFFPVKPAGGIGEAAVLVTADDEMGRRCRWLRNHGQDGKVRFLHHIVGFNARMDEIVAAYLSYRLDRFPDEVVYRDSIARRYLEAFEPLTDCLGLPPEAPGRRVWYTFVVRSSRRDELRKHLQSRGVESLVYYPVPLPYQPVYAALGHCPGDYPGAEQWASTNLALPLSQAMTDNEVAKVIEMVLDFHASG